MRGPAASGLQSCPDPDVDWIVTAGRKQETLRGVVAELCRHLVETGLPLARMMLSVRLLHPLVAARGIFWRQGNAGCTEQIDRGHDVLQAGIYLDSPLRLAYEQGQTVRRRLGRPAAGDDFPILKELADEGMTDYLVLPVHFTDGVRAVTTWATDRGEGFSDADIARLGALMPVLALLVEVHSRRELSSTVLDTYIGGDAGRRVLSGNIKRGDASVIKAVLWYCDLRGFTPLSEKLDGPELIGILNEYFQRMAEPVAAHGGEVLKFIGDAMLAIFPLASRDEEIACNAALKAARAALAAMKSYSVECASCGRPRLNFGVALHLGEVTYGNIGAPDRLDFTVIGPAVNRVVRIEEMCRRLNAEVLVSAAVAKHCRGDLVSVGRHVLRGVGEKLELFTLPGAVPQRTAAE
ncbi:MAG: adenylate/guanylate cyclase domain-containing protein [Rhodospirillales bacterium]